jgi:hypothetical protein
LIDPHVPLSHGILRRTLHLIILAQTRMLEGMFLVRVGALIEPASQRYSTANLSLNTSPELNKPVERTATGMFWGQMRLDIKPELADRVRPGYAGFRTKVLISLETILWCILLI